MTRTIVRERIPSTDPRLGRHIHHDSESRRFEFDTSGLSIASVVHPRHGSILDQGQVGSCTGNAGIGALECDPMFGGPVGKYPLDETGAVRLYSDAEVANGNGPYPPNDFGSDGLTVAKILAAAGLVAGYQHTFTVDAALKALSVTPIMVGVNWYSQSFTPDVDGRCRLGGSIAGGHELAVREYNAEKQQVWPDNSWGTGFGVMGRFYWTLPDFTRLLAENGDVTILLPTTVPAPVPVPVPGDPDSTLEAVAIPWAARHHYLGNKDMWHATQDWLASRGK